MTAVRRRAVALEAHHARAPVAGRKGERMNSPGIIGRLARMARTFFAQHTDRAALRPSNGEPSFTIVVPSLNQGRFLRECLDSIFDQRWERLEVLVVDGGSTDDSMSVVSTFGARIAWSVSEPDAGQSDAINKGMARATGDVVGWLNADDYLLPGAFAAVASAWRRQPSAPFYFGNGVRVDESGTVKARFYPGDTPAFDREALLFGLNYILQPATFMSHAAWRVAGPLDVQLRWGMDSDLWIRLSALGDPVAVPAVIAATREYGTTKTASGMFERVEELRQIAQRHTGAAITPGVLCYFADTLHRHASTNPDVFGPSYARDVVEPFWSRTAEVMKRFGAATDGTPTRAPQGRMR
jgi:hypothetical protein